MISIRIQPIMDADVLSFFCPSSAGGLDKKGVLLIAARLLFQNSPETLHKEIIHHSKNRCFA